MRLGRIIIKLFVGVCILADPIMDVIGKNNVFLSPMLDPLMFYHFTKQSCAFTTPVEDDSCLSVFFGIRI